MNGAFISILMVAALVGCWLVGALTRWVFGL